MNNLETKELVILRKVNQAISYAPDVEAVAGAILDIVIEEANAENASIMMPSRDGKFLEIRAAKGNLDETSRYSEEPLGLNIRIGEGIAGKVAQTLEPVILSDIMSNPMVEASEMKVKVSSLMSLPMIYGKNELVGVLNISHSKKAIFTRQDLSLMNIILAPAALALRNARLMREVDDINTLLRDELSMTDHAVSEFRKQAISMFGYISIGVITCDSDGKIVMINRKAYELTGLAQGDNIAEVVGKETQHEIRPSMKSFSIDKKYKGRILNFEFSPLPVKPRWQVIASIRDVTLDRFREKDIKRIDQYKDLIENAIDAMYVLKDGRFILTNKKFQEITGYSAEELFNRHYRHFITREAVTGITRTLRGVSPNGFIPNLEILTNGKDGKQLTLEISVGRLNMDGEDCFVGMVRDITSKKELLALKTKFLHVASHEIRVPLTVLKGYVRMLSKDMTGAPLSVSQQECIDEIEKHCEKLINFTNTLLDFARINSGKLTLNRQQVDLFDLTRHVVNDMQIKANEKGVSIVLEADELIQCAYVDPLRIEQALTNLIDNAIKHSDENGLVKVKLVQTKGSQDLNKILRQETAEVSVIDSGPGVKAEEARELFNEFFVGISGNSRRGIGLGLAITKEIIHAHGGMIEAKPSDEGGVFVITIPLNTCND
ncbi:MAG TPA: PAS domain S-box protein [Desulfomonilia bacterium]|jgi:PAS domain S-box-containing protein